MYSTCHDVQYNPTLWTNFQQIIVPCPFDYDWKKRLKCEFNLSRNEQITSELMRWFHPHFHVIGQPDWLAVNPEPDEYDWIKVFTYGLRVLVSEAN
jgi:hypothetical protein